MMNLNNLISEYRRFQSKGQSERAMHALVKICQHRDATPDHYGALANSYWKNGNHKKSIIVNLQAIRKYPKDFRFLQNIYVGMLTLSKPTLLSRILSNTIQNYQVHEVISLLANTLKINHRAIIEPLLRFPYDYINLLEKEKIILLSNAYLTSDQSTFDAIIKSTENKEFVIGEAASILGSVGQFDKSIALFKSIESDNLCESHIVNLSSALIKGEYWKETCLLLLNAWNKGLKTENVAANLAVSMPHVYGNDKAIEFLLLACQLLPDNWRLYVNLGSMYYREKRRLQSAKAYELALKNNPNCVEALTVLPELYGRLYLFDQLDKAYAYLKQYELREKPVKSRFSLLHYERGADLILQRALTSNLDRNKRLKVSKRTALNRWDKRVGFVTGDIMNHAVTSHTLPLYKVNEWENFSTAVINTSSVYDADLMSQLKKETDVFDISNIPIAEAQNVILSEKFDILIDMTGQTERSRDGLFDRHLSEYLVNMIGFPGTTGNYAYTHNLVDKYLVTPELSEFYSEKPLYIDCGFMPFYDFCDPIKDFDVRENLNLEKASFIFVSFAKAMKLNNKVIVSWLEILDACPDATLLLLAEDDHEKNMLCQIFAPIHKRGKLRFFPKLGRRRYLGLIQQCNLFLDTFPFSGASTAKDALAFGLPVLSLPLTAYSSRMCGSLNFHCGLDTLNAKNEEHYVSLAKKLHDDEAFYIEIKSILSDARKKNEEFNIDHYISKFFTALSNQL